ncbi:Malic enzyme [Aspergillus tanneri]|uniref:Malic enzyme n=1 Tax=Aspergillus tanneri TaxID=1220188 RepID=A0A5M9MJN9_9EURO|nr:Malic enzyme [Aspergillus tanneri]KAA8645550.1 Malic enzyme [Aspergillus tanneri]
MQSIVHPSRQLPVVLDCGTDNKSLLNDELYLGLRQQRVRGKEYDDFVDNFVTTARKMFPRAYIHFEDVGLHNASRLLDKFRPYVPCFNDDIQETGCVTLAALMAAFHFMSGLGIAEQISDAIVIETGQSKSDAPKHIWYSFSGVWKSRSFAQISGRSAYTSPSSVCTNDDQWPQWRVLDLFSVVKEVKPHVLIGTSTKPRAFTEEIIRELGKHVERLISFPLRYKAWIATGSPLPAVERNGEKYEVAECNNSTCFPDIGLGAVALTAPSPALQNPNLPLLPGVEDVRETRVAIVKAVIQTAVQEVEAQEQTIPTDDADLE